jgi:YebC/PmpR family DNA-binding regulatory protein
MAGHSKWANRVHRKTRQDARRSSAFSKLSRMITVAAREGGGDPGMNPTLRTYIDKAKEAAMPKDNIERAIKVGTGEMEGVTYESIVYEGYGPGGIALILNVLTDNAQRTVAEIRRILKEAGGNLGTTGSVTWMFEQKGVIVIPADQVDYDEVFMVAVEAGANDVVEDKDENTIEIHTEPKQFSPVYAAVKDAGFPTERAEVTMIPTATSPVSDEDAPKVIKLLDRLDEHDDIQQVHSNFEISDEMMDQLEEAS